MEQHVRRQYSDRLRDVTLGSPGYVPWPAPPTVEFNIMPLKLSEVRQAVKKARSSSAPGPNGVPYKINRNCPKVLELLYYLMSTLWKKQLIPSEWQRAVAVFILKAANSKEIGQFRNITLLNAEGKTFFSVLARMMTTNLLENHCINTNCHKAGVPGFPGCVEHSTMIWDQIQRAKREKTDLHAIWLDLTNAYGSAMGFPISPILFVAAFEVILIGWRLDGWRNQITTWTEVTPVEERHGRRHQPPSDSSMHNSIAGKDGRVDVMCQNEDQTLEILQPVTQKRSQKRQHHLHRWGRKNPTPL